MGQSVLSLKGQLLLVLVSLLLVTSTYGCAQLTPPSTAPISQSPTPGAALTQAPVATATDLNQYVTVEINKKAPNLEFDYILISNSSDKLVTVSFDLKLYDKDNSYIGGGKFDLATQAEPYDNFVLPHSTLEFGGGNVPWDSCTISNISVKELTNPFTPSVVSYWTGQSETIQVYKDMVFAEGPIIGNHSTLEPKWQIDSEDNSYYIVGQIKNVGESTPEHICVKVILRDEGKVVGVYEGGNWINPGLVPPPGETIKFKTCLGPPPNILELPRMPDSYDSYEVTIIAWSGASPV